MMNEKQLPSLFIIHHSSFIVLLCSSFIIHRSSFIVRLMAEPCPGQSLGGRITLCNSLERGYMKVLRLIFVFSMMLAVPATTFGQGQTTTQNPAPTNTQPAPALNLPTGRFAVINTAVFTTKDGIQQLIQQITRVNDSYQDRNAEVQALQQRTDALQREIQTQGPNLTPQALAAKQDELEQLQIDLRRKREDLERDYNKAIQDATQPVVERINAFLEDYARRNNLTLVLEAAVLTQARGLAYVHPGLDITQDFIRAYNAANPVTTASATTPPKSGGTP
jgi:Skp family chaperone for outer membrane proteins